MKTITVTLPESKVDLFWKLMEEYGLTVAAVDLKAIEDSHIREIERREQDPVLSQARPWSEVRQKYVGKGL